MTNLQQTIDDIGAQATSLQNEAASPSSNIWVNASAGTGKTKVLTDRVLRLLLPTDTHDGTPPQNILCLTFTKAGANEMIVRVMRTLSHWAVCSEPQLYDSLEKLLGHAPSLKQSDRARQLFATIIDTPEGLNITTIHAFCQSLLGRFTIEAGLPPNFKVMEESETAQIIKRTRDGLITDCIQGNISKDIRDAFQWLASVKNADQISKLFQSILNDRHQLQIFFSDNQDTKQTIYDFLDLDQNDDEHTIFKSYFSDAVFPKSKIEKLAIAMGHGTDKNKATAKRLNSYCGAPMAYRAQMLDEYQSIFLTQQQTISKILVTKKVREFDPHADDIVFDEGQRLLGYKDRLHSYFIAQSTLKLMTLAHDIIGRYNDHKKHLQKLDYDDLIFKTQALLSGAIRDWILYKLDYRLDHVLVDEAQDTSPQQWSIISELLNEFFSGNASRDDNINRTVFAVGDKKQSIFSFQGANPTVFANVQNHVQTQVQQANKIFKNIPMNTSFRSTSAVLNAVDATFHTDEMKQSVAGQADAYSAHTSYRQGQSGRIELWPLYKAPEKETLEPWTLPIEIKDTQNSMAALANQMAVRISYWIENKDILKSKNRPIQAGDIMVLVRRRNAFVDHLIRALKKHNVPVSGADRLVITNHIAVQDILSVLSFILMPNDDLALAEILKSPLIGWNDKTLESLAHDRTGTLWGELKSSYHSDVIDYLKILIENTSGKNAFGVISDILNLKTPNQSMSGWKSMMSRLGEDAIDPLEELLSMAQNFDANNPATGIQGFLYMAQSNKSDIKRELESAGNMVRIMTVHASKGLEAPIVFLPDTLSMPKPSGQSDDGFQWIDDIMPLWSIGSDIQNDILTDNKQGNTAKNQDEYNRLLYVAMTRAEDRLIVCGALHQKQKQAPDGSWYQSVANGFANLDHEQSEWVDDDDYTIDIPHVKIYETLQDIDIETNNTDSGTHIHAPLPQWAIDKLADEYQPPKILKPSQDMAEFVPVRSPLTHTDDTYRFRRGLLTHSLLQYLPDIEIERRSQSAQDYLDKQAPDISVEIKQSIKDESLKIINNPQFSKFFGIGSLAEVPVTGVVGDTIISGQIDRMLVTDTDIWIVDFKSNRPPPRDPNKIPSVYRKQLAAYKTLIAYIYPQHKIHCALLWTDGPYMMELDID